MKRFVFVLALLGVALAQSASAAGLMTPKDSGLPELEIREHHVKVVINNGFAVTEIDQVFHNPHDRDLDAVYTFPLPKDASLSELGLWIDGHEVIGEVLEKEDARKVVEEERQAGRETALAEQREYHAFDVLVSPVRAGADTRVRLLYLQPVEIDAGVGRYVYPLEEGGIDEEARAFWNRSEAVRGEFTFECTVRSAYPLDDVRAKGFANSVVTRDSTGDWTIWIDGEEGGTALDEDIVIYYRLAPDQPARVDLLPYRSGDGPGTFMLVITPGVDLEPIKEGVDWSVVLDVSSSMSAKIGTAADAVASALGELRPQDRFRITTFSHGTRDITGGWVPVTNAAVDRAKGALLSLGVDGGTNLHGGFKQGLTGLDSDRTSALLLVSDGGANIGPEGHQAFVKLLEKKDVRVFTFVMGQGANRPLLGRLAEESGGFSLDVSNQDDLYGRIVQAKSKLAREALHGVEVELDGVSIADRSPVRLPSAYFGQQIVMFGRYLQPGRATLRLRARISGEDRTWETRIDLPELDETYPEIERLWALARIEELQKAIEDGGDRSELREAIVDLGTTHSIVSEHTSMVVVREERFDELGIERDNLKRVGDERSARQSRRQEIVQPTRADRQQPMFGARRSHSTGGGGGMGSSGPAFLALLAALGGAQAWLSRRRNRS